MPSVRFQPANVVAEVPVGTLIHEAALRAGILDLELPCGGEGSCGLCKVGGGRRPQMPGSSLPDEGHL
jgi:ferredoxin